MASLRAQRNYPDKSHNPLPLPPEEGEGDNTRVGRLDAIKYQKRINGDIYVVKAVRTGRKKVALQTMYKKKAVIEVEGATGFDEPGVRHTSKTFLDQPPNKIISQTQNDENNPVGWVLNPPLQLNSFA